MNFKEKLNQIRALLSIEVKLETAQLTDGATVEAEQFAPEFPINIVTENGNVPLPIGTYETTNGNTITVEVEGVIATVGEKQPETEEVEEVEAQQAPAPAPMPTKTIESVTKEQYFEVVEQLETLKKVQLSSDLTVSDFMELPEGVHKLAMNEVTVVEVEVPNYDGKGTHKERRIVSILPSEKTEMSAEPIVHNPEASKTIELQKFGKPSTIKENIYKELFN